MAKSGAVWGIDIGNSALKALRCRAHESDATRIVVEAFDYVEYPKLLTQPDADRDELVREAIETFLERNELKGDRIAISVPGQSGLARFIKLPPVEQKKIPDIVKYEARQQIPFALEDVVWDYQPLAGGSQDEGFALETEIGLFAMKRDQVGAALDPLSARGIEVDCVQLAPLSVYNYTCFDRIGELHDEDFDPDSPPPSVVVLSIGVDTTDLVITNGFRVWQRNIPIGGSHFTKALTKELKLTFTKAEHLKRNATKAEDPKAVFQAMRPVFSDLVAEIQRSIGFFSSHNKNSQLKEMIALGNAMKLPGLQRFLSQNLDIPVKPVEEYEALVGGSVTATPAFEQNRLSFAVAYGLCVQGLGASRISTNLLPEELITQRIIRAKKPWAVAAAAALMIGMALNYSSHVSAWQTVNLEEDWKSPINESKQVAQLVSGYDGDNSNLITKFDQIGVIGENLQSNKDGRLLWLELYKVIDAAMPRDERPEEERERSAEDVTSRQEIHIESMDCQYFADLSEWYGPVSSLYEESNLSRQERLEAQEAEAQRLREEQGLEEEAEPADEETAEQPAEEDLMAMDPSMDPTLGGDPTAGEAAAPGPTGAGWVIQLNGHHFHNIRGGEEGEQFVRSTLLKNLEEGTITLPDGPNGEMMDVSFEELGVGFPVVVTRNPIVEVTYDPEAGENEEPGRGGRGGRRGGGMELMEGGPGMMGGMMPRGLGGRGDDGVEEPEMWKLRKYDFILQFVWQQTPRHVRQQNRLEPEGEAGVDLQQDL